jgi:hypothetical protein
MKPWVILALIFLGISAYAQPSQRQKMIHMAAVRIAETIQVQESEKDAFISLYQNYKKESAVIMSAVQQQSGDAEKDTEAKILSDFEKSSKLLELRKRYYHEFRRILSPSQIQKMYDAEYAAAVSKR